MSGYGDVKTRKFLRIIKWLQNNSDIEVKKGGRHNLKITIIHNNASYPIPSSHKIIDKYIVKDFMEWLVKNRICTKEEFDSHI